VIKLLVITPLRDLSRQQSVASQRGPVRDPDHLDGVVDPAFVRRAERRLPDDRARCPMGEPWQAMYSPHARSLPDIQGVSGNQKEICPTRKVALRVRRHMYDHQRSAIEGRVSPGMTTSLTTTAMAGLPGRPERYTRLPAGDEW
jgi:hypothetical protein